MIEAVYRFCGLVPLSLSVELAVPIVDHGNFV